MNATPSLAGARARLVPSANSRIRDELPYLAGLAFGLIVMAVFGFFAVHNRDVGVNDFSYMWSGGHTVLDGHDPYDGVSFRAESLRFGTAPPFENVFAYPPWVALALAPLAALPLWVASGIFTFGGMLCAALALRALLRAYAPRVPIAHTLAGAALFASQPGIAAMEAGQWGFLIAAVLAWSALAVRRSSPRPIFVSIGLLLKPQLSLFSAWAILRSSYRRIGPRPALALAGAFAGIVVLSTLVFPNWPEAYRTTFVAQRLGYQPPTTPAQALFDLIGAPGIWVAVALLIGAVIAGLAFDPRGDAWLAIWIAISSAFPVYSWSYDQIVLVMPIAIATGVLARRSVRAAVALAAVGYGFLLLVPTLLYEIADRRQNESFSAFVSLGVLAILFAALWRERRVTAEGAT